MDLYLSVDFLFSKGYTKIMRTWRYWDITDKPWIDELKKLLNIGEDDGNDNDNNADIEAETAPRRTFVIKTTNGSFECEFTSESELISKIKERFPKMSDETVSRIISNPSNYVSESKKDIKSIINEVIDEFIANEGMKNMEMNGDAEITPDMNLGLYSPLQ